VSAPRDPERANEPSTSASRARPVLVGRVSAVCIGPGGIPKHAVESARVGPTGVEGDRQRFRFHGGPNRALCLFSVEDYASLRRDGVACEAPGTFGENVLTEGLDFRELRADDELVIGDEALVLGATRLDVDEARTRDTTDLGVDEPNGSTLVRIAIHDVREPCKTLKSVDPRFPNLMLGRSGFVCRVIQGGELCAGMSIRRVDVRTVPGSV